jgi:N-carbamoyl-L-amino-acid hydrolase
MGASTAIDEARLWRRHMDMGRIGATPRGGLNRPALSADDAEARAMLAGWARARGFTVAIDPIGNLFVRRAGSDSSAAPILTGSHLDTQPTGGKFDGIYGVLAGFEALEALEDGKRTTRRPIEVVVWTNEEGARFQPGCMGSMAFAGTMKLDGLLGVRDRAGTTVADALALLRQRLADVPERALGFPVAGYIEAHIEQGPRLEATGHQVGVVTGIQGQRWFEIEILGEEAHAGTTPLRLRRDALKAATSMVAALEALMDDPDDIVRFTVGRFEVSPGSPNTVPGRVLFTIDFRHPDQAVIAARGDQVEAVCRQNARGCTVNVRETINSPPCDFDPQVIGRVRGAAERLGLKHMTMPSGAGHDAKYVAKLCPTAMIFVPCERGVSHNEAENASPADLAAGARVLAEVLVELADA